MKMDVIYFHVATILATMMPPAAATGWMNIIGWTLVEQMN